MVDHTLPLPGLSPVAGKPVIGRFDGRRLSSDGGLLVLREVEKRLGCASVQIPTESGQCSDRKPAGIPT